LQSILTAIREGPPLGIAVAILRRNNNLLLAAQRCFAAAKIPQQKYPWG
jgi:hypothetical protein